MSCIPFNFLGLDDKYSNYNEAKFVIIPVAYDLTTSYKPGTRFGPESIISASPSIEFFDEDLKNEAFKLGIHTMTIIEQIASSPKDMLDYLENVVDKVLSDGKFPILLGGEHSLSLASIKAQAKKIKDFSVLHLDAHADMRCSYQGTPYSHACIARRVVELNLPLTQVGIRSFCKEQYDFMQTLSGDQLITFQAKDICDTGSSAWMDEVVASLSDNVYITFDLDVFDPSIMPAVGTPEPGGLTWYPTVELLKKVAESKKVIGFDVVELAPLAGVVAPDVLTAKLVYKLISLVEFFS